MNTINEFEFRVLAVGPSSGKFRRMRPDLPMPSPRAGEAINSCMDEIQATLASHGFTVARTGYGVHGLREIPDPIDQVLSMLPTGPPSEDA